MPPRMPRSDISQDFLAFTRDNNQLKNMTLIFFMSYHYVVKLPIILGSFGVNYHSFWHFQLAHFMYLLNMCL